MASTINAITTGAGGVVATGDTSGALALQTNNGTTAMTIDTSQNVGIGTASPDSKLVVSGYTGGGYNTALNYSAQYNYLVCGTGGYTRFRNAAGTDLAQVDNAGVFSFNSGYGSMATAYGCRAWANFNGTSASPITPRASGNVSSVTKSATGKYTVNFTNAMPDANYAINFGTGNNDANSYGNTQNISAMSTTSFSFVTTIQSGGVLTVTDLTFQTISVFR